MKHRKWRTETLFWRRPHESRGRDGEISVRRSHQEPWGAARSKEGFSTADLGGSMSLLTPRFPTSGHQNYERIYFCHFKSPGLCQFVTATTGNEYRKILFILIFQRSQWRFPEVTLLMSLSTQVEPTFKTRYLWLQGQWALSSHLMFLSKRQYHVFCLSPTCLLVPY